MTVPSVLDLVMVSVASAPGTSTTIDLGPVVPGTGALTFAAAGAVNNGVYYYKISDGAQTEKCYGIYNSSAGTITRTTIIASVDGVKQTTPINASANAIISSDIDQSNVMLSFIASTGLTGSDGSTVNNGESISVTNPVKTTIPTFTILSTGSGTYVPPSGAIWIRVRLVGGGGAGGGVDNNGGNGGNTTFSTLTGYGGTGGPNETNGGYSGGAGGSASGGFINTPGAPGQTTLGNAITTTSLSVVDGYGGDGGSGFFGAGGQGGANANPGFDASGYGAGGGGRGGTPSLPGAAGGGAGGYVEHILAATSYSYSVGAGGINHNAGGGDGSGGVIVIEEHYNY